MPQTCEQLRNCKPSIQSQLLAAQQWPLTLHITAHCLAFRPEQNVYDNDTSEFPADVDGTGSEEEKKSDDVSEDHAMEDADAAPHMDAAATEAAQEAGMQAADAALEQGATPEEAVDAMQQEMEAAHELAQDEAADAAAEDAAVNGGGAASQQRRTIPSTQLTVFIVLS